MGTQIRQRRRKAKRVLRRRGLVNKVHRCRAKRWQRLDHTKDQRANLGVWLPGTAVAFREQQAGKPN